MTSKRDHPPDNPFILASASPRRKRLLTLLGCSFQVRPVSVKETRRTGESPEEYPERMSRDKAEAALERGLSGIILAADTVVIFRGKVLEKPSDREEARRMLERLSGNQNTVVTGYTMVNSKTNEFRSGTDVTTVRMRTFERDEIQSYVRSGEPLDKAGAYAIQDSDFDPVRFLEGCPASVMGLPVCRLRPLLSDVGIECPDQSVRNCDPDGRITCAIRNEIMNDD